MARTLKLVSGGEPAMVWHADTRTAGRHRPRRDAGRLLLRRLSALRRDRGARADHGRGARACRARAASCSASATASRSCAKSGLLPGVLMRNAKLHFICRDVYLRVERSDTPFTRGYNAGQVIRVPVAHGEGNYIADGETVARARRRRPRAVPLRAPDGIARSDVEPSTARPTPSPASSTTAATCSA